MRKCNFGKSKFGKLFSDILSIDKTKSTSKEDKIKEAENEIKYQDYKQYYCNKKSDYTCRNEFKSEPFIVPKEKSIINSGFYGPFYATPNLPPIFVKFSLKNTNNFGYRVKPNYQIVNCSSFGKRRSKRCRSRLRSKRCRSRRSSKCRSNKKKS